MVSSLFMDLQNSLGIISALVAVVTAGISLYSFFRSEKSKEIVLIKNNNNINSYRKTKEAEGDFVDNEEDYSYYSNLSFKILDGLISDTQDLFDVIRGDHEKEEPFQVFLLHFKSWLALVNKINYEGRLMDDSDKKLVFQFISNVLQDHENKTLFQGVSQNDRSSLLAIQTLIKGTPNKTAISRELELLSLSLQEKHESLKWQKIMSISSLIFSILGILATILLSR